MWNGAEKLYEGHPRFKKKICWVAYGLFCYRDASSSGMEGQRCCNSRTYRFIIEGYETEIKICFATNLIPLYLIVFQSRKVVLERSTSLDQHFEPILKFLIKRIMEGNSLVQLSACSALAEVQVRPI